MKAWNYYEYLVMTDILQMKKSIKLIAFTSLLQNKKLQQKSVHNLHTIPYVISTQKQRDRNQRYVNMPFYSLHIH